MIAVNKKIIILAAAALIAAVCGIRLLITPTLEREYVSGVQEAMIDDLTRDIQSAEAISELTENAETQRTSDITIGDDLINVAGENANIEDEAVACDPAIDITPAYYPPVMSDPVPDNAFPESITGIGILTIDSIDLRLPVAEGIDSDILRIAPGRVPQTAQIGDIGNAVIAGHRNYTYGSMFNRLGEVEIGEIIRYQARNGEMMEFEVFEIAVIEPENQIAFIQPLNESVITLYTCTPVREATHRLIIRARRFNWLENERSFT